MSEIEQQSLALKRKILFTPLKTKQALHDWIQVFLGIDVPDCIVCDEGPNPSNSSPMEAIWSLYDFCLKNDRPDINRVMIYASRDSMKSLSASIFELLCLYHLDRDTIHIAATRDQSVNVQKYVRDFVNLPVLRDFSVSDTLSQVEVVKYTHLNTGEVLTEKEWLALSEDDQKFYSRKYNYVKISVMSFAGTNSAHSLALVIDEVDVVSDRRPYDQAKFIPSPRNGKLPITVLTSTRKSNVGLVQEEIDNSHKTGLLIWHWNIIDMTEKCPASRHRPDLPKLPIYRSDDTLQALSQKEYNDLNDQNKALYVEDQGFAGCLTNCKMFAVCRGKLATKQTSTSKMLKPISDTQNRFRISSVETAKYELLCWKTSSEGLVYPRLNPDVHRLTAAQIAEAITGDEYDPKFSKTELYQLVRTLDKPFSVGIDWGYSHCFSVVVGFRDGNRMFIIDSYQLKELDDPQKVEFCDKHIKHLQPTVWADPEAPSTISLFRRHGYNMRKWKKGRGSVMDGIQIVRSKINPAIGAPHLFFLKDDAGVELLFKEMSKYHFKMDAAGTIYDEPEKVDDHSCFTADTEALTDSGWKSLASLAPTDRVLAVDNDGSSFFEFPTKLISKPYTGTMWRLNHHHIEFTATDDHRHSVMTQTNWKINRKYVLEKRTVDEMYGEMYWPQSPREWPAGKGFFPLGKDEAWFAGFWLAEGCFHTHRPTFILVDQKKQQHIKTCRETLTRLGWRWSETLTKDGVVRFIVSQQKNRAKLWREVFGSGAKNKKLPISVLLEMNKEEREAMWEGYMCGDGSRTQSGWHFDSVSKDLIEGVQVLSLMLGYGCRVVSYDCMKPRHKVINGTSRRASQIYRGHILRRSTVSHVNTKRIAKIENFDGQVYCLTTTTGQFLARTAGKPFVAGNCDSARYMIMNEFAVRRGVQVAPDNNATQNANPMPTIQESMKKAIEEKLKDSGVELNKTGRKGKFSWSF